MFSTVIWKDASFWLIIVAQSDQRIHFGGAARRDQAGKKTGEHNKSYHRAKNPWINS